MRNEFLEPEDYFSGYNNAFKKLKQNKEANEFSELCFRVLEASEDGKKLMQLCMERFVYPATPSQINENYDKTCIWYEGFRQAFRHLHEICKSYQAQKEHENTPDFIKQGIGGNNEFV